MRWLLAPILALSLLTGTAAARSLPEPEIWFNPHTPADMMSLFNNGAPWHAAARKVKVLTLVHWWLRQQSDATLLQIFDFAKQHHMKIELDTEAVAKYQTQTCGGIEGYTYVGEIAQAVSILQRLGVQLEKVDMDEPLFFGSYAAGPGGCQATIPDLINRTAQVMQSVVAAFPGVQITEIEPIPSVTVVPTWQQDETAFHIGLAQRLGIPVSAIQLDINWDFAAWKPGLLAMHQYVQQQNIQLGIIYDGSGFSNSSAGWINSAVSNFEYIEGTLGIIPQQAAIETWNAYPTNDLPETDPTTVTWLINRYVRPRSALQVQFVGQGANGKLTTVDGKPIPNVTVQGFLPGVDFKQPLPTTVVQDIVPATAVSALIGIRVNAECSCSGTDNILFGTIQYQESGTGSSNSTFTFPTNTQTINGAIVSGEVVGGTTVTQIVSFPGQSLILNGNVFPVTAGAPFTFTVPAGTVGGSGWFGNVILIWIDAQGNGSRITITPGPGKTLMSTAVTNADGTFRLFPMPRSAEGPVPVTVEFDGANGSYRPVVWTPLQ